MDVVLEFVRLDEKISKLESTCPGPRLATCEAWIEHLQTKLNELMGVDVTEIKKSIDNRDLNSESVTSSSTTAVAGQQTTLPSHVIDNGVMQIDGYTAEHAFPYNNNKAVAYGNGSIETTKAYIPPFNTNSMSAKEFQNRHMNGAIGNGIGDVVANGNGNGGIGGHGITRLLPTNDRVVKTPTQDLVNVSTMNEPQLIN